MEWEKSLPLSEKIRRKRDGFSLVEMVVILTILGILMSVAFQGVNSLGEAARKAKAISSLKAIANAYRQYMEDTGHPIRWKELDEIAAGPSGYDATLIAAVLAKGGYLNAVEAWTWDFDYRVKKYITDGNSLPAKICDIQRDGTGKITSAKVSANFRGKNGFPISVCAVVAANTCTNDDFFNNAGEIPIAYSRGLRDGNTTPGTWADGKINFDLGGVLGSKGGFIVFLDGHVEWYNNLGTGDKCTLRKYGTTAMTNKIYEALPKGGNSIVLTQSLVLSWKGGVLDCGTF
ncbi:MAG: type II secretion system GspH family protein [Puniceicoccales bacterium]|jgi:general secretion pathway protein G|nr:type II secretion system GspH family protein [Puniceicoccales bacterium]